MNVWQEKDWPHFKWSLESLIPQITRIYHRHGMLLGNMSQVSKKIQAEAHQKTLLQEAKHSLSLSQRDESPATIVPMLENATNDFSSPLTVARLCDWYQILNANQAGNIWRTTSSQAQNHQNKAIAYHCEPLPSERIEAELAVFLNWLQEEKGDPILKGAIGHIWFAAIQPFAEGNDIINRAILLMQLARAQQASQSFCALSVQWQLEQSTYDYLMACALKGGLDLRAWLDWFLGSWERAIDGAQVVLGAHKGKAQFWAQLADVSINARQRTMLQNILNGLDGHLTTTKWANLTACSQDTAYRDILDLIDKGVLRKSKPSGRSSHYKLILKERA